MYGPLIKFEMEGNIIPFHFKSYGKKEERSRNKGEWEPNLIFVYLCLSLREGLKKNESLAFG